MLRKKIRRPLKPSEDITRVNERIRIPEIRVIGSNGKQLGVLPTDKAIQLAREEGLDLVEVAPDARPPVCKIMDYGKFRFEVQKKKKSAKTKQHVVKVKEIKFHPKTGENDYSYRLKHAMGFLEKGYKVKASMVFRGREMAHQEYGLRMLKQMQADLAEVAEVEMEPKLEGRSMTTVFVPKKDAKKKNKSGSDSKEAATELTGE